jgi:hypothetical protein
VSWESWWGSAFHTSGARGGDCTLGQGSTRRSVLELSGQNPRRSWTVAATGRGLSHDERELVLPGP